MSRHGAGESRERKGAPLRVLSYLRPVVAVALIALLFWLVPPRSIASARRVSSSTPSQREEAAWPSRSTRRTFWPNSPRAAERLTAVVVFPVPPFSFTTAMITRFAVVI